MVNKNFFDRLPPTGIKSNNRLLELNSGSNLNLSSIALGHQMSFAIVLRHMKNQEKEN